jgi:hypothetical protein
MIRSKVAIGLAGGSLALVSSLAVIASISASAVAAPSVMSPCYKDIENGGLAITQSGGVSTYGAAANQPYARSENIWGTSAGCVKLTIGKRVVYSFDMKPLLGATGYSVWNTVSQLQGPTTNGTWPGPPVEVVIESGQWRIEGGYAVPNGSGGYRSDLGYAIPLSMVKVGTWQHLKLDVLLGGPGTGTVTVWLDGVKRINAFHPAAGTMFTVGGGYSTDHLQIKTGEYTGLSNSADTPTWQRTVEVQNVSYTLQ